MLPQAFWTSLRILVFRAGPEDLPYDASHRLTALCIGFAVLANSAVAALELPLLPAFLLGGVAVAALGFFTRVALRARQLDNRFQQTFNALLVTSSLLGLALLLPLRQLLPLIQEMAKKLQTNPELLNDPANVPLLPGGPVLLAMLLLVWQFAVTAFIYRRAANTKVAGGILIALLCVLTIMSFKLMFGALLG